MKPRRRVLFLGMDAGDAVLIRRWIGDGTLGTLRRLFDGGLVGATTSLEGFFEGATWPSFWSGVTPARHGFHRLWQLEPGTYDLRWRDPGEFVPQAPFWDVLSAAGRRVAVLDVPLSGVSSRTNGIRLAEWGSHDATQGFRTWPPELKGEVLARFGNHPLRAECDDFPRTPSGYRTFRDRLVEGVHRKADLTIHFLKQGRWDFFAQVFTESHCVGHQCWHLHDPRHPSHDPELAAVTGDPVRDVYVAIDTALGHILGQVDGSTVVVFLASHRMAHNYGAQFLLPQVLTRLGVAEPSARVAPSWSSRLAGTMKASLGRSWRRLPQRPRAQLERVRRGVRRAIALRRSGPSLSSRIDCSRSRCFPLENGLSIGGIRVNLAGREPRGVVDRDHLASFCEELAHALLEVVDCDTGRPAIRAVKQVWNLYAGDRRDHLPDLLVEWDDERAVGNSVLRRGAGAWVRLASEKIGVVEGMNAYCRTGDHRPEGLFVAAGEGIRRGSMDRTVSIMDLAPTITHLLGETMQGTDGRVIDEVVDGGRP